MLKSTQVLEAQRVEQYHCRPVQPPMVKLEDFRYPWVNQALRLVVP